MDLKIIMIDGEEYELSYEKALEITMAHLCKEHGWDAHTTFAELKKERLIKYPEDMIEELHYVPYSVIADLLEPSPAVNSSLSYEEIEAYWSNPDLTEIRVVEKNTIEIYGF